MVKKNTHCGLHFFPYFFLGYLLSYGCLRFGHRFQIFADFELNFPGFFGFACHFNELYLRAQKIFFGSEKSFEKLRG